MKVHDKGQLLHFTILVFTSRSLSSESPLPLIYRNRGHNSSYTDTLNAEEGGVGAIRANIRTDRWLWL